MFKKEDWVKNLVTLKQFVDVFRLILATVFFRRTSDVSIQGHLKISHVKIRVVSDYPVLFYI